MILAQIKTKDGIECTVIRTITSVVHSEGDHVYTLVESDALSKSNRYTIVSEVEQVFLVIANLPIAKDEKAELIKSLLKGLGVREL